MKYSLDWRELFERVSAQFSRLAAPVERTHPHTGTASELVMKMDEYGRRDGDKRKACHNCLPSKVLF